MDSKSEDPEVGAGMEPEPGPEPMEDAGQHDDGTVQLAATHTTAAAALGEGSFLALLPGGAATKAGVVFGDTWPQVKRVKMGSWADEMAMLAPGDTLVSINSVPVTTFEAAKSALNSAAAECTAERPFIETVWQRIAEGTSPGSLSCPVAHWGLLSWNREWITASDGSFKLFHTAAEPGPDDRPWMELPVSDPLTNIQADPVNPRRLILDNGVAIVHLKFDGSSDRDACVDAFAKLRQASTSSPALPELDTATVASKFPFKIGKYRLGPMNPSKPPPQGGFGYVMAGINSETRERVCAKINHNVDFEGTPEQRKEIMLQAVLQHEGVVRIKDVVKDVPPKWKAGRWVRGDGPMIIVIMELMCGGELYAEVVDSHGLSEDKARFFFRQILLGLSYCHGRGIAHRDIKLENLMLSKDKTICKIGKSNCHSTLRQQHCHRPDRSANQPDVTCAVVDFGLSKISTVTDDDTLLGTIQYAAPEMFKEGGGHDHRRADVWAAGVCLFAMTEVRFPFESAIVAAVGDRRAHGGFGGSGVKQATRVDTACMNAIKGAKYRLDRQRSAEYRAFLAKLLCVDPATRYTAVEALHDPWIRGTDWSTQHVDELVTALHNERATLVTPLEYSEAEWLEKMAKIVGHDDNLHDGTDAEENAL